MNSPLASFLAVQKPCSLVFLSSQVRHLLYITDAEGMNFLMHSAAAFESKPAGKAA